MSADTTVVLLGTKGKRGEAMEYRAVLMSACESLFWRPDYPSQDNPRVNREVLLTAFHGVRPIADAAEALREASTIERELCDVEYGVRYFDLSSIYFPTDAPRRRRRGRRRRPSFRDPSGVPAH